MLYKLQVVVAEESFHGISGMSFVISLTQPAPVLNSDAILSLYSGRYSLRQILVWYSTRSFISLSKSKSTTPLLFLCLKPFLLVLILWSKYSLMVAGNTEFARALQTYLLSRDHANLKSEFQHGKGKVCLPFIPLICFRRKKKTCN